MFFELLILITCSLIIAWILISKKNKSIEPPELSGRIPIVGHGHMFFGDGVTMHESLTKISTECLEKGGVVTMQLGPFSSGKVYVIADPEDALNILNTCLTRHFYWNFSRPILGNGLLTADAITWKKHRRLLTPAFNQHVLDSYIGIFNTQALDLVEKFAAEVGRPFDHEHLLRMYALETICGTACGLNPNEYTEYFEQYLEQLEKWMATITTRMFRIWCHNDFLYNLLPEKVQLDTDLKHFKILAKTILEKTKQKKVSENKELDVSEKQLKSLTELILDVAKQTGAYSNDDEVSEEIDNMIVAAHETTASTLTFALTLLGSYEDAQEKAFKEISEVCGDPNKPIDKDDLSKLVYIEAVIKETMRLYPIVFVIGRDVYQDVKLKNYTMKAKSSAFMMSHGLLRHSMWGADAHQFRPERWFDKDTLPDPKYIALFGLGKRACIGKTYAMISMKMVLAHILRKYRVSADANKIVIRFATMSRPDSGHYVTLLPRWPSGQ